MKFRRSGRAAKLLKLENLTRRRGQLEDQLEGLKENDPEELARIQACTETFKQHAQRWTENLFAIKSWLVKKKGVASYQVDQLFKENGLPKDLDIE